MVLFDRRLISNFPDYGILIPIDSSKIVKVIEALESDPVVSKLPWGIEGITETISRADLERAHASGYLDRLFGPDLEEEILSTYELIDKNGTYNRYNPAQAVKPLEQLFQQVLLHQAGTTQACRLALKNRRCYFLGGGMHHAHRTRGTGFCLLNDQVIALKKLQAEGLVKDAWIVDVDAHKGDGTASILRGDDSILTLSIHMGDGWPLDTQTTLERGKDNPSLVPADVEILQFKGEDRLYNPRLRAGLAKLESLALERRGRLPDLVLVVDGADPYEKDELPSTATLKLTLAEMLERDLLLDKFFEERNLPAAYINAGGYGKAVWEVYVQFLRTVLPHWLTNRT